MSRCESSFRFRFPPSYKGRPGGFVAAPAFLQRQWIRIKKRVQGLSRDGRRRRRRRRRELERARLTPTWAGVVVRRHRRHLHTVGEGPPSLREPDKIKFLCFQWLTEKHKKALFEALEKIKAELMILGFISLLLTFGQKYIVKICIPYKVADTMLPCSRKTDTGMEEEADGGHRRRLLTNALADRNVSRGTYVHPLKGKVPLISTNGHHQLHILIFFLAVFHVASSATAMALGRLNDAPYRIVEFIRHEFNSAAPAYRRRTYCMQTRGWKHWEGETSSPEYEFAEDPSRFRYTHETSFVRRHTSIWNRLTICFYFVHLAPGSKFNFQKHIKRTPEDDFKTVAGISPALWASALIILLLDVHGWKEKFWASMIPLVVAMLLPLLSNYSESAFQITYFFWIWYEFDLKSCFHDNFVSIIVNVIIGLLVQFLCSYITLPLYALVSQMGSHMKRSIFDEETSKALIKWHQNAKKKQEKGISRASSVREPSSTMSPRASPVNPTQRSRSAGHTGAVYTPSGSRHAVGDHDLEAEVEISTDQPNKMNSPSQCLLLKREDKSDADICCVALRC
ncbi:hypothetical protein MUK42_05426, partial [Musa troglodytarum]